MNHQDKVAVVTGGASGLGMATAQHLIKLGYSVGVLDLQEESPSYGDEKTLYYQICDISSEDAVSKAISAVRERFGRIDVLVNCAGIAPAQKVFSSRKGPHNLDVFKKVLDVNLVGTFNVLRMTVPVMLENEGDADGCKGVIVNTASVAAYEGQIGQAAYSASKGGIVGMALPIARELASSGVRIMTIAPGIFKTAMVSGFPQEVQDNLAAQIPFPKRLGQPSEYAHLVQTIIENNMLNGSVIRLDGSIRMKER